MKFVFGILARELNDGLHGDERGFFPLDDWTLKVCRGRICSRGFFVEREWAERSPVFKQVIPYTVVKSPGGFLLVERLPKGAEARLHGKFSVGLGGHIEPPDREVPGFGDVIFNGMCRELSEELGVSFEVFHPLGVVNENDTAVGRVHYGFVHLVELSDDPTVKELDQLRGHVVTREVLAAVPRDRFELWSEFLLDYLLDPANLESLRWPPAAEAAV